MPDDDDEAKTDTEAGLVRAAALIGQLGDPLYPKKLNAPYREFVGIGLNERPGYASPADLAEQYPGFLWFKVEPHARKATGLLGLTMEGRHWIAHLYVHVFAIEHAHHRLGLHGQP